MNNRCAEKLNHEPQKKCSTDTSLLPFIDKSTVLALDADEDDGNNCCRKSHAGFAKLVVGAVRLADLDRCTNIGKRNVTRMSNPCISNMGRQRLHHDKLHNKYLIKSV